jgi:hypothetical protein
MEIFIDGGLFELLIATIVGYVINFIFLRKYLLIIYSAVSVIAPVLIIFLKKGDLFYFLSSLSILNSILLVILLWTKRTKYPNEPLFTRPRKNLFTNLLRKRSVSGTNIIEQPPSIESI